MISQNQIARLFEAREYGRLIERILSNGRCRSRLAQRTLSNAAVAKVSAYGLGIQRLCEMTYRPTALADDLAAELCAMQRDDGLFVAAGIADESAVLAGSATAIAGLIAYIDQCRATGEPFQPAIQSCIEKGEAGLAKRLHQSGATQHGEGVHDAVAGWAVVLWQLGDASGLRKRLPVDDLLHALDEAGEEVIEDELSRFAHAMAA